MGWIEFLEFHRAWRVSARNGPIDGSVVTYMETSAQYREFAEQCKWLAARAETEHHRSVLKEMAEEWEELADEVGRRDQH